MSDFEVIIYEKKDNKGYITLNRPKALNAYNIKMRDELFEALNAVNDDPEVAVVILKAAGEKAFCAGADLSEFLTAPPPVAARQVRFEREWQALRAYAAGRGVRIFGDIPIYVAQDGADHRAHPELFQPNGVAGVPPEYFAVDGQRWGNPLYDWDRMRAEGFLFWRERLAAQLTRFDLLRIDLVGEGQGCGSGRGGRGGGGRGQLILPQAVARRHFAGQSAQRGNLHVAVVRDLLHLLVILAQIFPVQAHLVEILCFQ